jgi:membrane peptidoglycan carboxypeptidase
MPARRVSRRLPTLLIAALGVAVAFLVTAAAAWESAPPATRLDSRVGRRLAEVGARPVRVAAVAPILVRAVVATEDERFYRHHGIDILGVLRALPYDITHLSFAQGASTITEQVGKVLYLGGNDHSPWRKLEDAALALKLEERYSKNEILAAYLNSAYFGEGAVGVRAASERYFRVAPRRLTIGQATVLAGLVQSPSAYDPLRHPGVARSRQIEVLRSLVRNGVLTEARAAGVLGRPVRLSDGTILRPVRGVDLSPGPVFVWWQLVLGGGIALLGVAAAVTTRVSRLCGPAGLRAVRVLAFVLAVAGAAVIVRGFRNA